MCVVMQGLDASNWGWVRSEHIHVERQCRLVPPYKLQKSIRVTSGNEQIETYTPATTMPMKAAPYLWQKRSSKRMGCRRWSTLTCYPRVPTLQKDCGETGEWARQAPRAALYIYMYIYVLVQEVSNRGDMDVRSGGNAYRQSLRPIRCFL